MTDLTLEQVLTVERFAWHPGEYVFVPGSGVWSVYDEYDCDEQQGWESFGRPEDSGGTMQAPFPVPEESWHHLDECDCEFCVT